MELHRLDTGLPRFLQTSITVFVRGKFDRAKFPVVFDQLLNTWPVLKSRMNMMVRTIRPCSGFMLIEAQ